MSRCRLLQGQALDVYQQMSDHDVEEYQILKENLLKRFRLTEGGYRKRFKQSKIENGETPEQFIDRLRSGIFRSGATWQVLNRLMKVWRA